MISDGIKKSIVVRMTMRPMKLPIDWRILRNDPGQVGNGDQREYGQARQAGTEQEDAKCLARSSLIGQTAAEIVPERDACQDDSDDACPGVE